MGVVQVTPAISGHPFLRWHSGHQIVTSFIMVVARSLGESLGTRWSLAALDDVVATRSLGGTMGTR